LKWGTGWRRGRRTNKELAVKVTRLLLTSLVVFLSPYFCFADFTGPVVSVLDGDTIEILHKQRPERIRLSSIDCPEKGQAYGHKAKQAASAGTPHRPTSAQLITSPTRASRLAGFFELP
jgi:endonuclease YncB( thermonuclease family)